METYTEKEIDDYINGNLSFLLVKSKDKNFYYEHISKLKILNHPELLSIMKEFNFPAFHCFLLKNPEISSINDFYEHFVINYGYKDAVNDDDLKLLLNIREKYALSENEFHDLLNTLGTVLIFHDYVSYIKSPLITKIQNGFSYIKIIILTAKKLELKTDNDLSNKQLFSFDLKMFFKYRSIIHLISDFIKRPNHKPSNSALNYLCFVINNIAKDRDIQNNLVDFTIPLLKDLKEIFPEQLNEIIKLEKSYLLKRIAAGKNQKMIDDIEQDKSNMSKASP